MARTSPQPNRRPTIGGNFDLLKKSLASETNPVRFRQGKVIAYSSISNTVDVQIAGATDDSGNAVVTAGIKLFGNFTPDVNQAVWLVTDNTDIFAIGQLAPYGSAGGGGGSGNVAYQANAPTSPAIGDVWIESDVDIYDVATYAMTFTNKTINLTSNTLTGTKAQFNTAMSDADFATIDGTETLTNKTLTDPIVSSLNSGQLAGFRNLLINGDMRVKQRATLTTTTNVYQFTADRWWVFSGLSTVGAPIYSTTATLTGFFNILRVGRQASNTGTAAIAVGQTIESANVYGVQGKTLTLSFWARAGANFSSASSALTVVVNQGTGIDQGTLGVINQTWTGQTNTTVGTSTLTTSWQKFSYTYSVPSTATELNVQFLYFATGTAGANDYFDITGVQLEQGTIATPFEYLPFGTQLNLCQRYYQTSYPIGTALQALTNVTDGATFICINTSDSGNGGPLPTSMRAAPTFAIYSTNGSVAAGSARNNVSGADVTGITLLGGNEKSLPRLNKSGGLGAVGTPFNAHWTASAEMA
jgi:hypothetical protein